MPNRIKKALGLNVLLALAAGAGLFVLRASFYELWFWALSLTLVSSLLFVITSLGKSDVNEVPFVVLILRFVATIVAFGAVLTSAVQLLLTGSLFTVASEVLEVAFPLGCFVLAAISFIFFESDRRLNRKKTRWYPIGAVVIYFAIAWVLLFDGDPVTGLVMFEIGKGLVSSVCLTLGVIIICALVTGPLLFNSQAHAPRIRRNRDQQQL